jgi:hypothetical protein
MFKYSFLYILKSCRASYKYMYVHRQFILIYCQSTYTFHMRENEYFTMRSQFSADITELDLMTQEFNNRWRYCEDDPFVTITRFETRMLYHDSWLCRILLRILHKIIKQRKADVRLALWPFSRPKSQFELLCASSHRQLWG